MAEIEIDISDGVMIATLNRPEKMNALSTQLTSDLLAAIHEASANDAVRVMVLTGEGRAFCAGAEVTADRSPAANGATGSDAQLESRYARLNPRLGSAKMTQAFANCDVPIIGAINGAAAGAGFGIALCCDIRIFAESARIGSIFIKRGLASDYGATYWLPRIVGVAKAFEIFYDGNLLDSSQALALGVANRVVPDENFMDEVLSYARQIAAGPPIAYTSLRRLVQDSVNSINRDLFLDREWSAQAALLETSDASEGFKSFIERREPEFTGS